MTTIVIDYDKEKVYADTKVTNTAYLEQNQCFGKPENIVNTEYYKYIKKVHKINDNTIFAGAGDVQLIDACMHAVRVGNPLPQPHSDDTVVFVVNKFSKEDSMIVNCYTATEKRVGLFKRKLYVWEKDTITRSGGYVTTGSGGEYAYGALMSGASPIEAIAAASKADPHTSSSCECVGFDL